jgi:hypothetical protein
LEGVPVERTKFSIYFKANHEFAGAVSGHQEERGMAHCLGTVIEDATFWEPYCRQSLAFVKSCLGLIKNEPDGISSKTGSCSCCQS